MSQSTSENVAIRILVVEDNAPDVMLLGEALREQQLTFEIVHLRDGEEAMHRILNPPPNEGKFDLIVLDLNMPRVSGLEVLEKMRQHSLHEGVPVLVMTSSLAPEEQREASRLRADRYLKKPADLYEFLDVVGKTVRDLVPVGRSGHAGN